MRSATPIRAAKIGYIVTSVLLCLFGILLIAWPTVSVQWIAVCCGVLMLLFGVAKLCGYFSRDLYRLAFQYDLAFGILLLVLGTIVLTHTESAIAFLCVLSGLFTLCDGLLKIQTALEARRFGIPQWWGILIGAVLTGALGAVLVFRPGFGAELLVVWLGITLLAEGLLSFLTVITAVRIIRHQQKDVIEGTCYEESED
mgnify:CR=1 FL=1